MNDQENNNPINTGDFKFQDFVPPTGKLLENEAEANNPDVTENVSQEAAIETTASQETSQEIQVATERLISDQEPQAVVQELSEEATPQCKTEDSIDSQETKVEVQVAEQAMEATPQLEIQKEKQSEQQILENAKNVETDIVTSDTITPLEEGPPPSLRWSCAFISANENNNVKIVKYTTFIHTILNNFINTATSVPKYVTK